MFYTLTLSEHEHTATKQMRKMETNGGFFWILDHVLFGHHAERGSMKAKHRAGSREKPPSLGLTLILSDIKTCGGDDATHRSVIFGSS